MALVVGNGAKTSVCFSSLSVSRRLETTILQISCVLRPSSAAQPGAALQLLYSPAKPVRHRSMRCAMVVDCTCDAVLMKSLRFKHIRLSIGMLHLAIPVRTCSS